MCSTTEMSIQKRLFWAIEVVSSWKSDSTPHEVFFSRANKNSNAPGLNENGEIFCSQNLVSPFFMLRPSNQKQKWLSSCSQLSNEQEWWGYGFTRFISKDLSGWYCVRLWWITERTYNGKKKENARIVGIYYFKAHRGLSKYIFCGKLSHRSFFISLSFANARTY